MTRILRGQQLGARRIPHYLNVPVATRPGTSRIVANDVGMVYAKSGTIIMSFFTLGQVARLIVEYFDGAN